MASATRRDTASSRRRRARLSTVPSFTPADSLVQPADDDDGGGGGRDDKDGLLLGAGDRASLGWWASGGSSNGLGAADMVHARWSLVSKIPDCLHVSNHQACHVEIFYLEEPYVGYPAPSSDAHLGLGGGGKSQNKNFEDHIIISTIYN